MFCGFNAARACGYGSLTLGFNNGHLATGVAFLYKDGAGCQHFLSKSFVWKKSRKMKKEKEKRRLLNCIKLKYYKEVLDFNIIEYHIIFLITQLPDQRCHTGDSLRTKVPWTRVLKKWYVAKYFWNNIRLSQILPKRGIWLFSPMIHHRSK